MKPLNRDHSILQHIVSYCDQINETIVRFGNSTEIFSSDPIYRNAAALCIKVDCGILVNDPALFCSAEN